MGPQTTIPMPASVTVTVPDSSNSPVFFPGCGRIQALQSAERIRAVAAAPINMNVLKIPVTTSIGVTAVAAEVCEKQLLTVADAALYQAKSEGRNRSAVL